jgi:integrase
LRVLGPYAERHGFRLIVLEGEARKSLKYGSLSDAEQARQKLVEQLDQRGGRMIAEAIAEYEHAMVFERGRLAASARHACARLLRFLPADEPLSALSESRAAALYRAETERLRPDGKPLSVATQHVVLQLCRTFFGWCVDKGYVAQNPFAKVRKLGRQRSGKPQLSADEARRFLDAALAQAKAGDAGALAVALQLALGLRSNEALSRRVRDLDEDGAVLHIPGGKTANARRRPHIPEFLRPALRSLIAGRAPDELLFGDHGSENSRSTYLRRKVIALCQQAGVPVVCPHSLRGLHATLALGQGMSGQAVAAALGHGSFAITARHYADPTAVHDARVQNVLVALDAAPGRSEPLPALAERLRTQLSHAQIDALIDLLRKPAVV